MRLNLSESELKNKMKDVCILCDTREQENKHIIEFFDSKNTLHKECKLDIGDYSFCAGNEFYNDEIVIERKRNLDEIAGNFTSDRHRFESEFIRAKVGMTKFYLLIENASYEDVINGNYQSKLSAEALFASLCSWQTRYDVNIVFCKQKDSGKIINGILKYYYRNVVK